MKKVLSCISAAAFSGIVSAQTFVSPVSEEWLKTANEITVITMSGDSVTGSAKSVSVAGSQVKNIAIKDAAGEKHKFEAAEIKLLKYKLSKLAKMQQVAQTASQSIENAVNTNYAQLASQGYAIWENVKSADGESVYLLQVLNAWFCSHLKVYLEPSYVTASVGGRKVELGEDILVVKDGKTIELTERKYRKEGFAGLFGDCPEVLAKVADKERDWDDVPEHVKLYEECRSK